MYKKNNKDKVSSLSFINFVIYRLIKSTRYSLNGLKFAFQNEFSFRAEVLVAGIAILVATFVSKKMSDIVYLMTPIVIIIAFELCNTAIEKMIDEFDNGKIKESYKIAKDCASSAVFLMILWAIATWSIYFYEAW